MWEFATTGEAYGGGRAVCSAEELYRRLRARARWSWLWSVLSGRSHSLLALSAVAANCRVRSRWSAGTRTVPIPGIRGSEGRCGDFDADFRPLQGHSHDRWVGIAAAWELGRELPPVELVQIGDFYFVRDGHHRISVARAMGQEHIEAEVTVWDVVGPLPWEERVEFARPLLVGNPAAQSA